MKIIEIDGLITLEAEAGKVLTTLLPSSLRAEILYLGIYDSADNYIEIDEVPEIEMPERPNLEEQQEELTGLTLAEAYHLLLNENRVLKEENEKQNKMINIIMRATSEIYTILEPLLVNSFTIDKIPEKYREQVEEIINNIKA